MSARCTRAYAHIKPIGLGYFQVPQRTHMPRAFAIHTITILDDTHTQIHELNEEYDFVAVCTTPRFLDMQYGHFVAHRSENLYTCIVYTCNIITI